MAGRLLFGERSAANVEYIELGSEAGELVGELVAVSRQVCAAVLCRAQGAASGKGIADMSGEMPLVLRVSDTACFLAGSLGLHWFMLFSIHAILFPCFHCCCFIHDSSLFHSPFVRTGAAKMMRMTERMNQISQGMCQNMWKRHCQAKGKDL